MKNRLICITALCSVLALPGCFREQKPVSGTILAMGTVASVTVPAADQSKLESSIVSVSGDLKKLETLFSIYDPESEISKINKAVNGQLLSVSPATLELLLVTRKYHDISRGCFDPTVMPLMELWGLKQRVPPAILPNADAVSNAVASIGYRRLVITGSMAGMDRTGIRIDLGGIAKGYAVDVCISNLMKQGTTNVMVDLGGNIRCLGAPSKDRSWKIGVRNPFNKDQIVGTINLPPGMAVATSGNYERFVVIEGKRYAHIIDPRTGYPVEGMAGVTVISPTATEADAMSTSFFVLGLKDSGPVLRQLHTTGAIFIPDSRPLVIHVTRDMMRFFQPASGIPLKTLDF